MGGDWAGSDYLAVISLPALHHSVNCQTKVAQGVCSLPFSWQRHWGLFAMAKREQHKQYKQTPTSAMTTLNASNVVEQLSSTLMVLAHAASIGVTCKSCKARSRRTLGPETQVSLDFGPWHSWQALVQPAAPELRLLAGK